MSIRGWTDLRMEIIIGALLRTGVILAAVVVSSGAVVYLAHHGREVADYSTFHGEPEALRTVTGIVHGAIAFERTCSHPAWLAPAYCYAGGTSGVLCGRVRD